MKEKSPAFQFYAKDFLTDEAVIRMSLKARGAYITLLSHAWLEGGIPSDIRVLSKMCGESIAAIWPQIESVFQPDGNGRLVNRRLEVERIKQAEWTEKCRRAGVKSGHSRRTTVELPLNVSSTNPELPHELNGNSSSSSSSSTPVSPPTPTFPEPDPLPGFSNFWEGFVLVKSVNEEDRLAACREWIVQDLEPISTEVCEAVRQAILDGWDTAKRNGEDKFIPTPVNWLKKMPWTRRRMALVG